MTTRKPTEAAVLMHDPSDELFLGVLHPDAALFADYIDSRRIRAEHAALRSLLSDCGLKVYTVKQLLLKGTLDECGNPLPGPRLDNLREFASSLLEFDTPSFVEHIHQERYKTEILHKAHPVDLVKIILNRPRIVLRHTRENTGVAADYLMRPMMNLFYMRDQMITTRRGVVLGRLSSPQRLGESRVAGFCLGKLGIEPVYRVYREGSTLEGGDYILSGDISFLGCGMRTSREAVDELLEAGVFGTGTVVVVHDRLHYQPQMHLDTYFNMIDPELCMLSRRRMQAAPGDPEFLTADVYTLGPDEYSAAAQGISFVDFLRDTGIEIIPVNDEDTAGFGTNFVVVGPREIVAVAGRSDAYTGAMHTHAVKVHAIDLTESMKGYGAVHCMTQIIPLS